MSATAAAAAKAANTKKQARRLSQVELPMPGAAAPELVQLPLAAVVVQEQVRTEFDDQSITELAADIAINGILQPLLVRKTDAGFCLVSGERRLRAAGLAKLEAIPAYVVQLDDHAAKLAQLAENIQRENLTLLEEANALASMLDQLGSVSAVAQRVHKSLAWVSKRISAARGLGHYAAALLADGITEDLELVLSVDKLEKATPGSNSAWALCERIREGKAGRADAREALALAKTRATLSSTPEPTAPAAAAPVPPTAESKYPDDWMRSHDFRLFMSRPPHYTTTPSNYSALAALVPEARDELHKAQDDYNNAMDTYNRTRAALISAQLRAVEKAADIGPFALHIAYTTTNP